MLSISPMLSEVDGWSRRHIVVDGRMKALVPIAERRVVVVMILIFVILKIFVKIELSDTFRPVQQPRGRSASCSDLVERLFCPSNAINR